MAQGIGNFIDRIQIGTDEAHQIAIGSSAYGVCSTGASTNAKTVNIPGFTLNSGTTVHIKFTSSNSAASPTLNISNTGAKPIMQYGTTNASTDDETTGWQAGAVLTLTYDGTNWIRDQGYNTNSYIDASIVSGVITLGSNTITPVTEVNGHTGSSVSVTASDLGLSNAMHFIGVVASNSASTPSDGTSGIPTITGVSSYIPAAGDVVIDKDNLREYVWSNGAWVLLGFTTSTAYDSNSITASTATTTASNPNIPTWISRVEQATDGKITIERQSLGTIPVANGGTGVISFTNDCVIVATGTTQTLVSRALKITESSSNIILTNNNANKNITIEANGSGTMNVKSTTGELTVSSTTGKLTVSSNYGKLELQGGTANTSTYSTLTLGNSTAKTAANQSEGKIILYSAGSSAHNLVGASTTTEYTHTMPNDTGWLVSASSDGVGDNTTLVYIASTGVATASTQTVGGTTQSVYLNAGSIEAITYTANRLYYSASTSSFTATNHFATDSELVINAPSGTTAISSGYTLEVNGKTKLIDALDLSNNFTITGNINPSATNTYYLGTGGNSGQKRWAGVFIGTSNTYGSPTQPIYWNNGVPEALTYTANRLYYSASTTSFEATDHYASTSGIRIGSTSAPVTGSIFQVSGTSTMQEILPDATTSHNLGSASLIWSNLYVQTAYIRSINAGPLTKWNDGILSIGESNTSIIKAYYSGSSTAVEHFEINSKGAYVPTNLAIGSQESSTPTYTLYVDGTTKLINSVGIGTTTATGYILNILGNMQIQGNIDPQSSPNQAGTIAYDLGATAKRWNDLYLYNDLSISNGTTTILLSTGGNNINIAHSTASINLLVKNGNNAVAELTMTAADPIITLDTTTSNAATWTLENDSGTSKLTNGTTLLQGNDYGFQITSNLYIDETIPTTGAYNLYVNGTTYHTGDVTFASATSTTTPGPKIEWSGANDSASIYYKILSNTEGRLIINTTDSNCLIGYAYDDSETIYMSTYSAVNSLPSFYPAIDNHGTLGLSTNRWSTLYIGTADTYGDPYLPVYWNEGIPTYTNGVVQKKNFSFTQGATSVTIEHEAYNQLYGIETFVIQIVVTSGESNLNGPISWESRQKSGSTDIGEIVLTTIATSGVVSGYILTARGIDLDISPSQPINNNGSSNSGSENNEDPGSGSEDNEDPPT